MVAMRRLLILGAAGLILMVLGLDLLALIGWPEGGPIGLAQVLAEHITLVVVAIALAVACLRGAAVVRVLLVILVVVSIGRFGGEWFSFPTSTDPTVASIDAMTWNLQVRSRPPGDASTFLRGVQADVVALQELTPEVSAAIVGDPVLAARYPYQAMYPRDDVLGLGLLSAYPLSAVRFEGGPSRLWAQASTPLGTVRIVNVHPLHGLVGQGPLGLPVTYEVAERQAAHQRILDEIASSDSGPPLLMLGDINTAPTEAEFGRFTTGFTDAHAAVGLGPGWTYRLDQLESLGIGLVRIDVVLSGPGLRPVAETTSCPPAGDHCAVLATLVADDR